MLEADEAPPRPGAKQILEWELRTVLDTSGSPDAHPGNRKAVCRVYLRELQEETGLSNDALQHVARVAGPRYTPPSSCYRHSYHFLVLIRETGAL